MFVDELKILIKNNPEIVTVTNRGLENKDGKVIFIAKKLLDRYPELQQCFVKEKIELKSNKKNKNKVSK